MKKSFKRVLIIVLSFCWFNANLFGEIHPQYKTVIDCLKATARVLNNSESISIWNNRLDSPIIIIDNLNNKILITSIQNGEVSQLEEEDWNNKIPLANSVCEYKNRLYATIVLQALTNSTLEEGVSLLTHEIFHVYQNKIGISNYMSKNYHLDEVIGRALLQIEMKALQAVVNGETERLKDAILIRNWRQQLYPKNNEDLYELNEGLAEYTGFKLGINKKQEYLRLRLNYNISRGYTNAFAYCTGLAYAIILDKIYTNWKQDADLTKGLPYLIKKAKPEYFSNINNSSIERLLSCYSYDQIVKEEQIELNKFGDLDKFKELQQISSPKIKIPNNNLKFTYNPTDRVIALDSCVLLCNIAISGAWGKLVSKSGILRLNNWSAFYLMPPSKINGDTILGEDYEIKLNKGWKVAEDNGIYKLVKE